LTVAKLGADVIIHHAHSPEEAEGTFNEIIAIGRKAWIVEADFDRPEIIPEFMERVFTLSSVFALINNSAIFQPLSFSETSLTDWNNHLNINLTTPFLLSQAFSRQAPLKIPRRIINILDWRALRPGADHFPYTISKAALVALTQSTAVALAPNTLVNGIAFGAVLPPSDGGQPEKFLHQVPINRLATLEEVSQTVSFLLTGPDYITGEIIHLDGGRHLK
jgi:pteridine reductase